MKGKGKEKAVKEDEDNESNISSDLGEDNKSEG